MASESATASRADSASAYQAVSTPSSPAASSCFRNRSGRATFKNPQNKGDAVCHPEVPAGRSAPDVERVEVEIPLIGKQGELPALLARPRLNAGAGVLVVADVFGRSPFYEELAGRLALAGYTALLPDFFFREGPLPERTREAAGERRRKLDDARSLVDLSQAIGWLKLQPNAGGRVGTVGFCMGGSFVLLLAAERDDLASVCYYGFPAGGPMPTRAPAPLAVADRIHGPLLGFWGDQDAGA